MANLASQPHPLWVVVSLGRVRLVLSALLLSSVVNPAGGEGWPAPWPAGWWGCFSGSPGPWPQPIVRELEWWGLGGDGAGGDGEGRLDQEGSLPWPCSQPTAEQASPSGGTFSRDAELRCARLLELIVLFNPCFPFCLPLPFLVCCWWWWNKFQHNQGQRRTRCIWGIDLD